MGDDNLHKFIFAGLVGMLVLAPVVATPANAAVLIAPFAPTGGPNNNFPFNSSVIGLTRYEEIWDSSLFGALAGQPALLTEIDIFSSQGAGTVFFGPDSLSLGTTTVVDTSIQGGGSMNANASSGETVVASGFTLTNIGGTFNSQLVLSTPFVYNPAAGNLLIDYNLGASGTSSGILVQTAGGGRTGAGRAGSNGFATVSDAMATQFVFSPLVTGAPEVDLQGAVLPSVFALGLMCLAMDTRARRVADVSKT